MFKTAIRSIKRSKAFSLINVAGLAIGMAVFLLIAEFVANEWGANRTLTNYDRLYRISVLEKGEANYYLPPGYVPVLQKSFPEIEAAVLSADGLGNGVVTVTKGNKKEAFKEEDVKYVDGNFIPVFGFKMLKGSASLLKPQTMVVTERVAKKYFGDADALGKTVEMSNQFGTTTYEITGILPNLPANMDIRSEVFLSIHTLAAAANRSGNDWADPSTLENGYAHIFLLLKPGANPVNLAISMDKFIQAADPDAKGQSIYLQAFKHLHLGPSIDYPLQTFGSLKFVYMLVLIAGLILLIAWVNYINLSTAQGLQRARETGVRKVLGASRTQLALRFMSETLLITMVSLVLALAVVQLLQPIFNRFIGVQLSLATLVQPVILLLILSIVLMGSVLAGGYVSLVLSSYKPIHTLKGKLQHSMKSVMLRKGLVVFQFSISIVFIIATIILYKQLNFMQTGNLGMELNQLLVVQGPTVATEDQSERNYTFKNKLAALPFVEKVAGSNNVPGRGYNFSTQGITRPLASPGDEKKGYNMLIVDQHFFDTYGIAFKQGKAFSEQVAIRSWNNERQVVINERAAEALGFDAAEDVVGKKIKWGEEFEVMGVVKDYHHLSFRTAIEPIIYLPSVSYGNFTVKLKTDNMQAKIATIEKLYRELFPGNPFDYFFADEAYDKQYEQEKALGSLFIVASLVAVFIACLGLFGLAAFSAQQRVKEIGVRKVLGASVTDITKLLSTDFVKLVVIAIIIGSPIAWWVMHSWLEAFPYRTNIDWWVFLLAATTAVLIAVGTVSFHAIRAGRSNPVDALRSE
jgi:putative ABC transport system permease protein